MTGSDVRAGTETAIPALGYGAANLGNLHRAITDDEAWAILDAAWESGIRHFDTAPFYGRGLSERRLGDFLRTKPRDDYVVSTKVGRLIRANPHDHGGLALEEYFHVRTDVHCVWDLTERGIRTSHEESLDRLGLDRVDILYLHDPERADLALGLRESLPTLAAMRDAGMVDLIGIGSMDNEALLACVEAADLDLAMVAGRFTLLDRSAERTVLPACARTGTRVVGASIFNSGVLASPAPRGRYEYEQLPDHIWNRTQQLVRLCERFDVALPAAAMHFILRSDVAAAVVVGASRPAQVRDAAQWATADIPDEFWLALAELELTEEDQ